MNSTGEYQKSIVPITFDELDGPDLHVGEAVIFAFDGSEYPGVCKGWTVNPNGSVYVSVRTGDNLLSIKLAQVWRAYDAKDAYFERQIAKMGATNAVKRSGRPRKDVNLLSTRPDLA